MPGEVAGADALAMIEAEYSDGLVPAGCQCAFEEKEEGEEEEEELNEVGVAASGSEAAAEIEVANERGEELEQDEEMLGAETEEHGEASMPELLRTCPPQSESAVVATLLPSIMSRRDTQITSSRADAALLAVLLTAPAAAAAAAARPQHSRPRVIIIPTHSVSISISISIVREAAPVIH